MGESEVRRMFSLSVHCGGGLIFWGGRFLYVSPARESTGTSLYGRHSIYTANGGANCSGLGVHISFVRSITMDSFKAEEILRMDKGGNKKCKDFFAAAPEFHEGMTIAERYGSSFGEDYKEKVPRLLSPRSDLS